MQVLNTYIQRGTNGWLLIALIMLIVTLMVFLLKDDITRFLEHHTIGARFYGWMKYVWIPVFVFCFIFTVHAIFSSSVDYVRVEAIIQDNYPIGPLYERYEIIEKRGDIWVLEQRDSWEEEVPEDDA